MGHLYFFHDSWLPVEQLVRLAGEQPEADHPVVFVGGRGRMWAWGGEFSGGSFPLPALFPRAGFEPRLLAPDEDVTGASRFLSPGDFQVILLPEPARLDARRSPELSWLRLPVHAGQRTVHVNPPGYRTFAKDHPPVQPGVRRSWLQPPTSPPFSETIQQQPASTRALRALPASWRCRFPGQIQSCPLPQQAISPIGKGEVRTSSTNNDRAKG